METRQTRDNSVELRELEDRAEDIALIKSQEGRRVIDLIKSRLEARMIELAKTDEQSKAMIDLLAQMGARYAAASIAVNKLASRYIAGAAAR